MTLRSNLGALDLSKKTVFLRADLNVPLENGRILNDYKLTALIPTIELIQKKGGRIVLATHIGRPNGYQEALSTKHLVPWFAAHGYQVRLEPDIETVKKNSNPYEIVLLENLRFFPGEQKRDPSLAQQLFKLADFYVNDAFALLHRNDTSITLLPDLFAPDKKTCGLLVEKELQALSPLQNPQQPFTVIVGGGKVHDKLPLISAMVGKAANILLCPAIVFTFLKAQGVEVGKSLVDETSLDEVKKLIEQARASKTELVFPVDYQIALNTLEGSLSEVAATAIPSNGVGVSIGAKTVALFEQKIKTAKTVFFNGMPGLLHRPETLTSAYALLRAMANSNAYRVVGGGESVTAAEQGGVAKKMDYCSTGGGATLAYITGEIMPGLEALRK